MIIKFIKVRIMSLLTWLMVIAIISYSCDLFPTNRLLIEYEDGINPMNVRIVLKDNVKEEAFKIYQEGKQVGEIPNFYGENDWVVIYNDSLFYEFRHFKTRNRNSHTYRFRLFVQDESLYCEVEIQGKTEFTDTSRFVSKLAM